jgi:hypothetical protein
MTKYYLGEKKMREYEVEIWLVFCDENDWCFCDENGW